MREKKQSPDPLDALISESFQSHGITISAFTGMIVPPSGFTPAEIRTLPVDRHRALLMYLWEADRKYAMPELSIMAMARFEFPRRHKIPNHILHMLEKVEKAHVRKETTNNIGGPL